MRVEYDTTTLLKSVADPAYPLPPTLVLEMLSGSAGDALWGLLSVLLTKAAFGVKVGSGGVLPRGIWPTGGVFLWHQL